MVIFISSLAALTDSLRGWIGFIVFKVQDAIVGSSNAQEPHRYGGWLAHSAYVKGAGRLALCLRGGQSDSSASLGAPVRRLIIPGAEELQFSQQCLAGVDWPFLYSTLIRQ